MIRFLHRAEAGMRFIQLRADPNRIDRRDGRPGPRQGRQASEVLRTADVFRIARHESRQALEDLPAPRPDSLGKVGRVELATERVEPVAREGVGPEPAGNILDRDAVQRISDSSPVSRPRATLRQRLRRCRPSCRTPGSAV